MYIAIGFILFKQVLPRLWAFAQAAIGPVMTIVITIAGLIMIFGAVGMHVSTGLGSTIFNWIGRAIAGVIRGLISTIRGAFRLVKRTYNWSRETCIENGMNPTAATWIALGVAALLI